MVQRSRVLESSVATQILARENCLDSPQKTRCQNLSWWEEIGVQKGGTDWEEVWMVWSISGPGHRNCTQLIKQPLLISTLGGDFLSNSRSSHFPRKPEPCQTVALEVGGVAPEVITHQILENPTYLHKSQGMAESTHHTHNMHTKPTGKTHSWKQL